MSEARDYIHTFDVDKAQALQIAQKTAAKLESKETTLITVIESLGDYVKDEDATVRSKAIHYLSQVLASLPPSFLSRQQLQVICQFLCDRIDDGGSVTGLSILQALPRFNDDMAITTARAMLAQLQDLQIRPQSQRFQIIELLNGLMSRHRKALHSLGAEFVVGVVDLVSGEKDPRNLMVVFSILHAIMVEWDISEHAEALFDSVFCYFPITFRPPPDDPYGITAQDLKNRLRECISASSSFAPYAFPQLMEKLDSGSPNVKKDVLQTLTACAQMYSVGAINNYSVTLWDTLKYEIFNAQEDDLADEALGTLQAIAERLSRETATTEGPVATYLNPIIKECLDRLKEPQHKQAKPAARILSAVAKVSATSLFMVVKGVLPSLLSLYQDADTIEKRRALLEPILSLLDSASAVYATANTTATDANPIAPLKDQLFEIFSQALMATTVQEVSFRVLALKCLLGLCKLPQVLQRNEIGLAVQYFNEILIGNDASGRSDLKDAAIGALLEISQSEPSLILDITVPKLMAELPDDGAAQATGYSRILEVLARLSVRQELSDILIRRLFSRFDIAPSHGAPPAYCDALLSTLRYCFAQEGLATETAAAAYYEKVAMLVKQAASASLAQQETTLLHENTMRELGRLACLVVRKTTPDKQKQVGEQIYKLFTDAPVFICGSAEQELPESNRLTIILSTYLLAGLNAKTCTPAYPSGSSGALDELRTRCIQESSPAIRHSILQHISLLVNKFLDVADLDLAASMVCDAQDGLLGQNLSPDAIRLAFWISKALVLRLHATERILTRLLDLLSHEKLGTHVARGFGLLFAPDEILAKENGANVRLLAKHKTFAICVPSIRERFSSAEASLKPNYLIALCGIIKHTDAKIILPEVKPLLPLLLRSLDLAEAAVKGATLDVLTVTISESPTSIEEHLSSLITRVLKVAANWKENEPDIRFKAIRCLRMFPGNMPESALIPFSRSVDRGIVAALDDPRRNVRKEAVDCRAAWLRIEEPEEED